MRAKRTREHRHTEPMCVEVLRLLREQGASGATDAEGARALHMHPITYARRRGDLCKAGMVAEAVGPDGQPVKRVGASIRPATVWVEAKHATRGGAGKRSCASNIKTQEQA